MQTRGRVLGVASLLALVAGSFLFVHSRMEYQAIRDDLGVSLAGQVRLIEQQIEQTSDPERAAEWREALASARQYEGLLPAEPSGALVWWRCLWPAIVVFLVAWPTALGMARWCSRVAARASEGARP